MKKLYLLVVAAAMFVACDLIDPTEVAVTDVTVTPTELTLEVGQTATLSATIVPEDADDQAVTWSSGNTAIARVDNTGVVVAQTAGTTTITVTTRDGGFTASCTVTVEEEPVVTIPVQSVSVTPETASVSVGRTITLAATVLPANATNKTVIWSSNATAIATVDANGVVTAVAEGEAIVTATTVDGGKTDFCTVTVRTEGDIPVTGVTLSPTSLTLYNPTPSQLTATVLPSNATNKDVNWSSSNPAVATVDENGMVTAVYEGSAIITATTVDGGRTANCNVTVRYFSTDFSRDKEVVILQSATRGAGIDVVFMGDGFSDRLIANGTYDNLMRESAEIFFEREPYTTFRDCFNVYYVIAVSENEVFARTTTAPYRPISNTALNCWLEGGNDTLIDTFDNNQSTIEYTYLVVDDSRIDNTISVGLVNSVSWHGTCHLFDPPGWPNATNDWGEGYRIGYYSLGRYPGEMDAVLLHETNGHAFAKLADEYVRWNQMVTPEYSDFIALCSEFGWNKNVDLTGDPLQVKWAKYLTDPRYDGQGLGVFEGGYYFTRGVWRPTQNGMMNQTSGDFNAPSREAAYYRINKLAFGADWVYDHETFVEFDLATYRPYFAPQVHSSYPQRPHTPPVRSKYTWREIMNK
jgi:uncharacterized protein YjdB